MTRHSGGPASPYHIWNSGNLMIMCRKISLRKNGGDAIPKLCTVYDKKPMITSFNGCDDVESFLPLSIGK